MGCIIKTIPIEILKINVNVSFVKCENKFAQALTAAVVYSHHIIMFIINTIAIFDIK